MFHWDRLYLGGGNSRLITYDFGPPGDVVIVPNQAGLWAGSGLGTSGGPRLAAAPQIIGDKLVAFDKSARIKRNRLSTVSVAAWKLLGERIGPVHQSRLLPKFGPAYRG